MNRSINRRAWLLAAASLPVAASFNLRAAESASAESRLAKLEKTSGGRLGVAAFDTGTHARIAYRADERFPFCSTFKMILTGAILARSVGIDGFLQQRIDFTRADVVNYSPVTSTQVGAGMTIAELCKAAIQRSDNTAANLLIKIVGGPAAVTAFARSIGDPQFRLDRMETALNSAIPGDPRDTSTPAAMARSTQALTLGTVLPPAQREQLQIWLKGNETGAKRIRAGVPSDWQVGDKTGSGDYGTANDLAILWPLASTNRKPVIVAIYHTQAREDANMREDVIAAAARIVADAML